MFSIWLSLSLAKQKVTPNFSTFPRTCLKRGYPWKSSWSSSDLSLIFNQHEEEKLGCSSCEAKLWSSVWLPLPSIPPFLPPSSFHHLSFPWRLRPAAGCSVKTLTLDLTLINHKPRRTWEHSLTKRRRWQERAPVCVRVRGVYKLALFNFLWREVRMTANWETVRRGGRDFFQRRMPSEDKLLVSDYSRNDWRRKAECVCPVCVTVYVFVFLLSDSTWGKHR